MKKVLSLSLYIASKPLTGRWFISKKGGQLYIKGLFTQIEAAKVILPGWDIWVYVGKNSISQEIKEEIKSKVDKMIEFDDSNDFYGTMTRFITISNKEVDYVYVKDVDSSITWQEKEALDRWIDSDKKFLICKVGAVNSRWPIMGQLWGSKGGSIDNMEEKVKEYLKKNGSHWWIDQEFLRDVVWPIAKEDCIQFGSDQDDRFGKNLPFPNLEKDKGVACGLTVISDKNICQS